MLKTGIVKIKDLRIGDIVLDKNGIMVKILEVKPFGDKETFIECRPIPDGILRLGASPNDAEITRIKKVI